PMFVRILGEGDALDSENLNRRRHGHCRKLGAEMFRELDRVAEGPLGELGTIRGDKNALVHLLLLSAPARSKVSTPWLPSGRLDARQGSLPTLSNHGGGLSKTPIVSRKRDFRAHCPECFVGSSDGNHA